MGVGGRRRAAVAAAGGTRGPARGAAKKALEPAHLRGHIHAVVDRLGLRISAGGLLVLGAAAAGGARGLRRARARRRLGGGERVGRHPLPPAQAGRRPGAACHDRFGRLPGRGWLVQRAGREALELAPAGAGGDVTRSAALEMTTSRRRNDGVAQVGSGQRLFRRPSSARPCLHESCPPRALIDTSAVTEVCGAAETRKRRAKLEWSPSAVGAPQARECTLQCKLINSWLRASVERCRAGLQWEL